MSRVCTLNSPPCRHKLTSESRQDKPGTKRADGSYATIETNNRILSTQFDLNSMNFQLSLISGGTRFPIDFPSYQQSMSKISKNLCQQFKIGRTDCLPDKTDIYLIFGAL